MLRRYCALLVVIAALTPSADAQEAAPPGLDSALDGVAWIGPGVSLPDLRGKTVVVLTYVTWCPKCNVWAPDLFRQLGSSGR